MELGARVRIVGLPQRLHRHLFGFGVVRRHGAVANHRLVVVEVGNAEIAQQRGAFKAGALVERHHLRAVFLLHDVAVLGHHHRRALVAVRPQLRQEHVVEGAALHVADKQHRVAVLRGFELPFRQPGDARVGLGFVHHHVLIARGPGAGPKHVHRRDRRGEQRQNHGGDNQGAFAQPAGVHNGDFALGIQPPKRHQQAEKQAQRQDELRHFRHAQRQQGED